MEPAYDEIYGSDSVVRAHYGEFERWPADQPAETMRFKRAEADLVFRRGSCRVARREGSLVVNLSHGGVTKDIWVLAR